jgi:hypothetical protein
MMPEMSWWEQLTGPLTGGPGHSIPLIWVGLLVVALVVGVAVGWWLRGQAGRAAGARP